ncbi:MAG: hypothetical protein V1913_18585 [Fibrobacterota bacterium]
MKQILLLSLLSLLSLLTLFLTGCYTVLLTQANMPPRIQQPVRAANDSAQANDSTAAYDSVVPGSAQPAAPAVASENRAIRSDCNCTVFEISNGLCWCTCDRCGVYHRVGYEYCPRGWSYSSYRWDYYNDYPWWYNRYNNDYRNGSYYDGYRHNNYGGGGSIVPSGNGRHNDSLGFIGNRNSYRDALPPPVYQTPSSSGKGFSITVSPPSSSPPPVSQPHQETAPVKADTSKANFDRIIDRKRMR